MSASEILIRARLRAGMTQREVADRAGVTQSVISAYERGRREPSLTMLRRLVDATGGRLVIEVEAVSLLDRVRGRREEIVALLAAGGANDIRVFGSAARGDERPGSDVDLLVSLDDTVTLFGLGALQSEVEELLGVPVDIVPDDSLKDDVRETALREAVPL